jgi:ATP-dependent Clp protease adaptor protein ClpS
MAEANIIEKKKTSDKLPKEPGKYKVIVCNDDVTPMDFVIAMLMGVFRHSEGSAVDLTMKIHNNGSAVAGVYTHEIAEQKIADATNLARGHGFPLILKAEAE